MWRPFPSGSSSCNALTKIWNWFGWRVLKSRQENVTNNEWSQLGGKSMTEVEASLECYLAALHCSWKRAVCGPRLSDLKENLIGLMKEDLKKVTSEIQIWERRLFDFSVGGSYMCCVKMVLICCWWLYFIGIWGIVLQKHRVTGSCKGNECSLIESLCI